MKAVEFIRKFGWVEAVSSVEKNISTGGAFDSKEDKYIYIETDYESLKKFTDAYDLVQKFGGLNSTKNECDFLDVLNGFNDEKYIKLKQAVALVEEVGECDGNY